MWITILSVVGILCSLSDDTQIEIIMYSNKTCFVGCVKGCGRAGCRIVFVTLFNILYGVVPDAHSNSRSLLHIF
jgi:protein tyrosine phosphatase